MNLIIPLILASLVSADTSIDAQKAAAILNAAPPCASRELNNVTYPGLTPFLTTPTPESFLTICPHLLWGTPRLGNIAYAGLTTCTGTQLASLQAMVDAVTPLCYTAILSASPTLTHYAEAFEYLSLSKIGYTLPQCAKACVNEDTLGGYNEFLNATFWMSQSPYVNWTRGMVEGEGRAFGKVCEGVLGRGSGIEVCVEGKGCADAVVDVVKGYEVEVLGMCKAVRGFGVVERDLEEVWRGVVGLPNCVKDYCLNEKGFGKGVNEFYYGLQTKERVGVVCSGYSFGALESCAAATCTAKDVDAVKAFEPGFKTSCDSVKSWSGLTVTTVATAVPTSSLIVSTQLNTAASTGTTKAAVTTNLSSAAMTTTINLFAAATFLIISS